MRGITILLLTTLVGCSIKTPPPVRLPQLNEKAISGPGFHELPRWSPDGKLIAFLEPDRQALVVQDSVSGKGWLAATEVSGIYFDWGPRDHLSYLTHRPELSGSPYPEVFDLHVVDVDGKNDRIVIESLYSPLSFVWFKDGQRLAALLVARDSNHGYRDVYVLDTATGSRDLLVSRQELNMEYPTALSLSSDETRMAVAGVRRTGSTYQGLILIYDIGARAVSKEIVLVNVFPTASLRDGSFKWIADKPWLLAYGDAIEGECSGVALYFLNIDDSASSFCIPTTGDAIGDPDLSADLSRMVFLSPVRPRVDYVMIGELASHYRSRLEQ